LIEKYIRTGTLPSYMESYINDADKTLDWGINMPNKVLIATLYSPEPVILAITKMEGVNRLLLLIDKEPDKQQTNALKLIKDSFGKVIDVVAVKTEVYDIVKVASKCVELIDTQPKDDLIYVNITSGRKTKAIGLLFAAYARHDRVKKIAYNPEEDKSTVVYLPRLSFKLTESQKLILGFLDAGNYSSIKELSDKIDLSTAMLYRAIDELKDMDLISTEEGLKLTDAGKIARL